MRTQSDQAASRSATRVARDGVVERIEFRGPVGERMFTALYLPPSRPRGSVLICPPLHGEFVRNYRREVLLARRLAHLGFAVERFHYRYTGNSDGEDSELTYGSMTEDALRCAEHLQGEVGDSRLFLVGTRWGALVAASAAAVHQDAGVVFWAPLLDASAFFKEAFRSKLVLERKDAVQDLAGRKELEARLRSGETVEGVAHSFRARLFETSTGRSLEAELGTSPRAALAVSIGTTSSLRPDVAALAARWRECGFDVETSVVRGEEAWWMISEKWQDESRRPMTRRLIDETSRWMLERTSGRERP